MSNFKSRKNILRTELAGNASDTPWDPRSIQLNGHEDIAPLLALLTEGGLLKWRAATLFGFVVNSVAAEDFEKARNIVRRLMWHMNEESGNIGWGIPEAFAEALVNNKKLAKEFSSILLSYIIDTGKDDNFCDHSLLRRFAFWAVGRCAAISEEFAGKALPHLITGLADCDPIAQGYSLWSLAQAFTVLSPKVINTTIPQISSTLEHLQHSPQSIEVFEAYQVKILSIASLASVVLEKAMLSHEK